MLAWSITRQVFLAFSLLLSPLAYAEDEAIAKLFRRQGIEGTIVISSMRNDHTLIHNDTRAIQRFSSASTFKVFNTLIALEEEVVSGKDSVFKWDGHQHSLPDWNHDQTLESAFKVSCVWCYQELARRIGPDKYREYLRLADYGVLSDSFDATTFWLDGSLQISALEQVEFLKKVYQRSLSFRPANYDILSEIMLAETAPTFKLFAKTGWAATTTPQIGWYVGYLETSDDVWVFATNIAISKEADLPLRLQLTREALHMKGIIQ
jgi:beta-lactamase class D